MVIYKKDEKITRKLPVFSTAAAFYKNMVRIEFNQNKIYAIPLFFVVAVVVIGLIFFAKKSPQIKDKLTSIPLESSTATHVRTYQYATLENLWISYRDKIQKDGRTIDRSRNYLSTSEGQSYALLRAVWMDDKETFDRVLKWTNNNLKKRTDDNLFAWKWGQAADGSWGVLTAEGGNNTATDADQDIALALIFATKRWNQQHYMDQAVEVLNDIWRQEVLELNGKYYLLAGNWAKTEEFPTINPSYFSFMAYPVFAEVNPEHPWLELRKTSYEVLNASSLSNLGYESTVGLPPDWVSLNKATGEIERVVHDDKTSDFSDDAFRVVWRVGLDQRWHKSEDAKSYLQNLSFLATEWEKNNMIYSSYTHDGKPSSDHESMSMYSGILPYFMQERPELAADIFYSKIATLYDQDLEEFKEDIGYYAQNWVWFGMAYFSDKLPNLYEEAK